MGGGAWALAIDICMREDAGRLVVFCVLVCGCGVFVGAWGRVRRLLEVVLGLLAGSSSVFLSHFWVELAAMLIKIKL